MSKYVALCVGDKIVIKGEEGYIVRIVREKYYFSGFVPYVVAIRMKESRKIVFTKLYENQINEFHIWDYSVMKEYLDEGKRVDQISIRID